MNNTKYYVNKYKSTRKMDEYIQMLCCRIEAGKNDIGKTFMVKKKKKKSLVEKFCMERKRTTPSPCYQFKKRNLYVRWFSVNVVFCYIIWKGDEFDVLRKHDFRSISAHKILSIVKAHVLLIAISRTKASFKPLDKLHY